MNRKQRLTRLNSRQSNTLFKPTHRITIELHGKGKDKKINRPKSSLNKSHQDLNLHGSLDLKHVENTVSILRNLNTETLAVIVPNDARTKDKTILSSTDVKNFLKHVPVSPNPKIEQSNVKNAARRSLLTVLAWIEVELVSDTQEG